MSSKGDENSGDQNLEMALLGEEERETERGSGEHGLGGMSKSNYESSFRPSE
jgi:hypothetical protein